MQGLAGISLTLIYSSTNMLKSVWILETARPHKHVTMFGIFLQHIRWFKFTLKPPYTVVSGNLLSAIWDVSHWTSFVKFGLKTA